MVLCILVSGKLSKMAKGHISSAYGAADARINVMREIVDGAKVVKFMVWEEAYLDRLDRRRVAELGFHRKFRALQVCCIAIGRSSPMLGATVAFIVYSRFFELTTATILPALSIFQSLRLPFIIPGHGPRIHSTRRHPLDASRSADARCAGRTQRGRQGR